MLIFLADIKCLVAQDRESVGPDAGERLADMNGFEHSLRCIPGIGVRKRQITDLLQAFREGELGPAGAAEESVVLDLLQSLRESDLCDHAVPEGAIADRFGPFRHFIVPLLSGRILDQFLSVLAEEDAINCLIVRIGIRDRYL